MLDHLAQEKSFDLVFDRRDLAARAVTEQRVQRRLAAILAADVVGYLALMERDEEATYAEFERLKRELFGPSLSSHEGRLIKSTVDGARARRVRQSVSRHKMRG